MSLEEWFNSSESVKNWLEKKKMSWEILNDLGAEGSIEQMIWDIDNESVSKILDYYLKEKLRTKEEIMQEIDVYYNEVLPKLWDNELNTLFNLLVSRKRILPSSIIKEFKNRDEILSESNPEVKKLMETSLTHNRFPSLVLDGKDTYKRLATVQDEELKNVILYYLECGLSPEWVESEYEDYNYIKNYKYKNEDLRNFLISLIDINDKCIDSSLVAYFFDIFKDWTEFWEDKEKYIMSLINTRWL